MNPEEPYHYPKRQIGFVPSPQPIRMEEAARESYGSPAVKGTLQLSPDAVEHLLDYLTEERKVIIVSLKEGKLSTKNKLKLLEENRQFMAVLRGESPLKFRTENVIYSILIFSAFVLIILSCLTAWFQLPKEVTITFVGTVVGGTIATIAQKLGKIGS